MNKYLLPSITLSILLFAYSCKKDNTTPVTQTGNTDTTTAPQVQAIDSLPGTYIGNVRTITDIFYGTGHVPEHSYDTTYVIDTVSVTKISADSFAFANGKWGFSGQPGHFKYSSSNSYNTGYGGGGSSSALWIEFNPASDSIYAKTIYGHYSGYGPYSLKTNEFWGKK